ncbi:uncharacterized protein Z520_03575 [Fonsecaea multimorphosa CBS 102226]|uniref:Cytochrome P450 monooxygenase n=1 Tax=Fonsecaea multimorphosa CBS 102226 TaxID=1442371 RepID=A0A0D2KW09_9EURO|nr:uncharacterized protein Z520_03575 [Fonsecaea multimorphosa CBS 102226]KIY00909.1 hypothetical protein Z520_03575 [Fonsecaea multimorphosa CBS 102226]OAL27735.1 hypothetical protein AYO22_03401 [Fonsecaea multimorphosa]
MESVAKAVIGFCLGHVRTILLVALLTGYIGYCVFRDPLRHIPGPLLARHLPGWLAVHAFRERTESAILDAHRKYGDVVRIGPRTVLAGNAEAVRRVLGYGDNYLDKSADYDALVVHTPSIFSEVDRTAHARKRRIAAHAYSMQSLTKMEDVVAANLAVFLRQMDACAARAQPMDAAMWFKFYAFDVIGDLAFGRSFGMLQRGVIDDFVKCISDGVEFTFVRFLLPSFLRPLCQLLVEYLPFSLFRELKSGFAYVKKASILAKRNRWIKRDSGAQRGDILGALMEARDPATNERLEFAELATNASTNIIAGSDTVTISLTAIIYHLLRNPDRAARLTAEVRGNSLGDIPLYKDIQRLPYLDACIKEGMRLTSPFAGPLPRLSPPGGLDIGGTRIPAGTVVNVMQCQIHKDGRIFRDPESFKPERWLDSSDTSKELDKYFLGFSTGPRSCIGKNIALLEMKLLLYSFFRRYDLSLVQPGVELQCRRYLVTKPLSSVLVRVQRAEVAG